MKRLLVLAALAGGRRVVVAAALFFGCGAETLVGVPPALSRRRSSRRSSGGDVDPELLAILACPLDKHPVTRQGNYLVCGECQRHYPIRDGIPVMLIDEALTPEQAAAARLE